MTRARENNLIQATDLLLDARRAAEHIAEEGKRFLRNDGGGGQVTQAIATVG